MAGAGPAGPFHPVPVAAWLRGALCLDTRSMYVLETVSRVGAIVELTFLFPASGIHTLLPDF